MSVSARLNDQERRVVAAMLGGEKMTIREIEDRARVQANSFHARKHYLERKGYRFDKQHVHAGGRNGVDYYVYWMVRTPAGEVQKRTNASGIQTKKNARRARINCPDSKCTCDSFFWTKDSETINGRRQWGYRCVCGLLLTKSGGRM